MISRSSQGVTADTDRAPKTVYEWGKKWDKLVAYIREHHAHDDAARVTKEQARAWVDSLKATDISPRTINFGYIAVARAAYKIACDAGRLKDDPFAGLAVKINKLALARDKRQGFTDEEARAYLQAARAHRATWVRWVVMVMAYSGCRLEEVIGDISWHRSIQCHSSCHEKTVLGDAKCCQAVPNEITKKPVVTLA